MGSGVVGGDYDGVNTADQRHVQAARLVQAAQCFRDAAARSGASLSAPATLARREGALQEISAGWYRLADAAAPRIAITAHARARRPGRDSEPPSAASRALDLGVSPRGH
jgi:hypothetical protein